MGRKRLPEGERQIDKTRTVILKIPREIFDEISKKGKPSDIILQIVTKEYKIRD